MPDPIEVAIVGSLSLPTTVGDGRDGVIMMMILQSRLIVID